MNNNIQHITLSQLNTLVGEAITKHLERSYWVVAEVVELRANYSGHCYLSLAEKENDKVLAQSRAAIWQQTYRMIKPYFESATGQEFAAGIKIRAKVSVSFHNVYGMNMTIQDIDPNYTVGELVVRRQQILKQLSDDGVDQLNRQLIMPTLPQRVAIISSPTAAGFEDFTNQLDNNEYNYKFQATLFSAQMQGEGAEASIIDAMERIFESVDDFDVVVIIRGGGAALDLTCFDNYNIAYYLTQMPIPVIVGIGHERDETVLDLVAHTALKTPTAVAAFLIDLLRNAEAQVDYVMERLQNTVHQIVLREKQHIYGIAGNLPITAGRIFSKKNLGLSHIVHRTQRGSQQLLRKHLDRINEVKFGVKNATHDAFLIQKQILEKAEMMADLADPKHILKKGYSMTMSNGKVVRHTSDLAVGEEIETILLDGVVKSVVQ